MDNFLKKKWIDALRSGEYKQGHGLLRSTNETYCCLGVLCDIYKNQAHVGLDWEDVIGHFYLFDGLSTTPPPSVRSATGITDHAIQCLIAMNDGSPQAPFTVIADWIEENL